MPIKTFLRRTTIMDYKYMTGDVMIGEYNLSPILDTIIGFIVAVVKFEVPTLANIIKK